jgi:hypothetical protein
MQTSAVSGPVTGSIQRSPKTGWRASQTTLAGASTAAMLNSLDFPRRPSHDSKMDTIDSNYPLSLTSPSHRTYALLHACPGCWWGRWGRSSTRCGDGHFLHIPPGLSAYSVHPFSLDTLWQAPSMDSRAGRTATALAGLAMPRRTTMETTRMLLKISHGPWLVSQRRRALGAT